MKRYSLIILIGLLFFCFGFSPHMRVIARKNAGGAVCSEPAGDVATEGFEGVGYELGACGSADCWDEPSTNTTVNEDLALSGLSGGVGDTAKNCSVGLQTVYDGNGDNFARLDTGANTAHPYVEFSVYIDAETITDGQNIPFFIASSDTSYADYLMAIRVRNFEETFQFEPYQGASDVTSGNISIDTWYYIRIDGSDAGTCTCRIGTTYNGTDILNDETFTCGDVTANPRYYWFGQHDGWADTATMIFGYTAVDDDGTF